MLDMTAESQPSHFLCRDFAEVDRVPCDCCGTIHVQDYAERQVHNQDTCHVYLTAFSRRNLPLRV